MKRRFIKSISSVKYYLAGKKLLNDRYFTLGLDLSKQELLKKPGRSEVLNFLLSAGRQPCKYLEIGVRDPDANFNKIIADEKYSVDPGFESNENKADFKMTSDEFFEKLSNGIILSPKYRFDVIFIDGMHTAAQADRDIENALKYINEDGFVVLHDCNPPTEWHARETYNYLLSPAGGHWNGTTWKAFLKWRRNPSVYACCIDTDWGLGILSKSQPIGKALGEINQFYEFADFSCNREKYLNLVSFEDFKKIIGV